MSNTGETSLNKKLFETVKGATGGYNINIFSPGVSNSVMSKTANLVKNSCNTGKVGLIDEVSVKRTTNI